MRRLGRRSFKPSSSQRVYILPDAPRLTYTQQPAATCAELCGMPYVSVRLGVQSLARKEQRCMFFLFFVLTQLLHQLMLAEHPLISKVFSPNSSISLRTETVIKGTQIAISAEANKKTASAADRGGVFLKSLTLAFSALAESIDCIFYCL